MSGIQNLGSIRPCKHKVEVVEDGGEGGGESDTWGMSPPPPPPPRDWVTLSLLVFAYDSGPTGSRGTGVIPGDSRPEDHTDRSFGHFHLLLGTPTSVTEVYRCISK